MRQIQNALKIGPMRDEILQVIELTAVVGIHACNLALPIVMEELANASGKPDAAFVTCSTSIPAPPCRVTTQQLRC